MPYFGRRGRQSRSNFFRKNVNLPLYKLPVVCYTISRSRGISAAGSAQHWQCWGQRFESAMLHAKRETSCERFPVFLCTLGRFDFSAAMTFRGRGAAQGLLRQGKANPCFFEKIDGEQQNGKPPVTAVSRSEFQTFGRCRREESPSDFRSCKTVLLAWRVMELACEIHSLPIRAIIR